MRPIRTIFITAVASLALSACSIYQLSMRQGNILSHEAVSQLHDGMTREQVREILGTPLVDNPFNPQRWDYVFYFHAPGDSPEQRTISVTFRDGRVASIKQSGDPNAGANIRNDEQFLRDANPDAVPTQEQQGPRTPQT